MPTDAGDLPLPPPPREGGPSMLDLVRLSRDVVFPPGGEDLYRQIARLTELREGNEVLDAACGRGVSSLYLARSFGVSGMGVDSDPVLVQQAAERSREEGLEGTFTFETASLDDLPYRDGTFDVAIGEIGLAASADPARAVSELARVTRPYGCVVLVQLIWTGNVDPTRREILVQHLGARPMILVEWKQLLRDAGVVDLAVEDWSDAPSPFRPAAAAGGAPFPDFSEIFTLRERVAILLRAWKRWGWKGVKGAVIREREIHRLLTRERVLGLSLIKGTKWPQDLTSP
ncbi:class I SAM-dependent methyltransferase [Longimicrobium sp.]|uniref:class I SAM-dependent methyltransferase n=1 Tax=Longimicrobium sp. TaxID=2029185 RepID=UPI002E317E32|nr:methyltransferase domain-containing protein [Longimicrobium sp.]HEX6042649.1 methyltransferase domain-containing protein [Longimicrobium sp.]